MAIEKNPFDKIEQISKVKLPEQIKEAQAHQLLKQMMMGELL